MHGLRLALRRFSAPGTRLMLGGALAAAGLTGCPDPNFIGVQDYGSIYGTVYDTTGNQPIYNAIVSVGSLLATHTDVQGHFSLQKVPIGNQTVTVQAVPYAATSVPVEVTKDQAASAGAIGLKNALRPARSPAPGITPSFSPGPSSSPSPAASASASPSPAASASASAAPQATPT